MGSWSHSSQRMRVEELGKHLFGESLQSPILPSPWSMPSPQHLTLLYFLNAPDAFLHLIRGFIF
jgi:hypothetical protein